MRITHLVAAAALTAGLVAAAPAAQAAPVTSPSAHSWAATTQVVSSPAAKSAKARTRISVSAPAEVKAGDDFEIKAQLTRKSGSKYKAYAKKTVELVLLDGPGAETGTIVDKAKTNKKGKVTFTGSLDESADFLVAYEGGSKAKASESDVFTVSVTS